MTDLLLIVGLVGSTYVLTRAHCDNQFRDFLSKQLRFTKEELQQFDRNGGWRAH